MRRLYLILLTMALVGVSFCLTIGASSQSERQSESPNRFLGFDRNAYPGDEALPVLRKTFAFSSYWLGPPPGEKKNSWEGKRALLQEKGFGFLLLFNAQASRKLGSADHAYLLGELDAGRAVESASHQGFPPGATIFLDIEEGGRLSSAYHQYLLAWAKRVKDSGYGPGVYCSAIPVNEGQGVSITTVQDIQDHLEREKVEFWVYNDACPPSPGCVFPEKPPAIGQSGYASAHVWQYAQSPRRKELTTKCATSYAGDGNCYAPGDTKHKWFLDANVADSADPSHGRN